MKTCPTCQKTYTDDSLNFCLDDGSFLNIANSEPETVVINTPVMKGTPQIGAKGNVYTTYGNENLSTYANAPKKSSKAWMWILAILGIVVLVCGGGLVGFFAYVASMADDSASTSKNRQLPKVSDTARKSGVHDIDLSVWNRDESNPDNIIEYVDDELIMGTTKKGYFYVLIASAGPSSEGALTKVTIRNVENANSKLGYGLVFHSTSQPLVKDYAFLIDSKQRRYRVVRHVPGREIPVIEWKNSGAIKEGQQDNVLEVKDSADKIELTINGEVVDSIKNMYGQKNGFVGVYSGDAVKAGFKNLQVVN